MNRFEKIRRFAEGHEHLPRQHTEGEDIDAQWLKRQRVAMREGRLSEDCCEMLSTLLERYVKSFWWERLSTLADWVAGAGRLPVQHGTGVEHRLAWWMNWQNRATTVLSAGQRGALNEITEAWPSSAELRWIRAGVVLRLTGE